MLNTPILRWFRKRRVFDCGCTACYIENDRDKVGFGAIVVLAFLLGVFLWACSAWSDTIYAGSEPYNMYISDRTLIDGYTLDQWATAIGRAENSRTHPYGIMVKYKHTTPRQACMNTVKHRWQVWNMQTSEAQKYSRFIDYLGQIYAPTYGAKNDIGGLNKNWVKNVGYYLRKGNK